MSESGIAKNHNKSLPSNVIDAIKIFERISDVPIATEFYNENSSASVKLLKLYKKLLNTEIGITGSEKSIDEKCTIASRLPSRMPQNIVQHWVNTGHLPYQSCIDNIEHEGTGSSLSQEQSSYNTFANANITNIHNLNSKQLYNNSSTNSSVDTTAYILSNTNITKKENACSKFFKKKEVLKLHKDINNTDNKTYTAVNISNKTCIFDIYDDNMTNNKLHQKITDLGKTNAMEETVVLKSPMSHSKDINKIYKCDKQVDGNNHSCQNRELSANSIEETISRNNKQIFHFKGLHNDSLRFCRQKKLYSGRDSPIDIVIAQSKEDVMNEEKRNLHPAFRNSPTLQKRHGKFLHKRRKRKFFLESTKNIILEDSTSSNNSTTNDIDKRMHPPKRQKTLENTENHVKIISPMLKKEKLYRSCQALRKQIERFSSVDFMNLKGLKQSYTNYISMENAKLNKTTPPHTYKFRVRKRLQDEMTREKCNKVSYNKWDNTLNPVVILERLSETIIRDYTKRNNLQSEIQEKSNAGIKNMTEGTNNNDFKTRSVILNGTTLPMGPKNILVNSADSDTSTVIIYNSHKVESTVYTDSDTSTVALNRRSLSSKCEVVNRHQSAKLRSDEKLTKYQPLVVLERLSIDGSCETKLNTLHCDKDDLKPIDNLYKSTIHKVSSLIRNELNETNAGKLESGKTKEKANQKKLLCFQTNMNDSDSHSDTDLSFIQCTFELCTSMKTTMKNKTVNEESSNLIKVDVSKDCENIKSSNKRPSKKRIIERKCDNKRVSIHNTASDLSISNEGNILKKVSSMNDKLNDSSNRFNNRDNKKVHTLTCTLFESDTSEEDENICTSNVRRPTIKTNSKDKTSKLILCTKAYDSDSD